ncbi:MAG: hypothetical protein AB7E95_11805 [Kiritimatiellales bacterium]
MNSLLEYALGGNPTNADAAAYSNMIPNMLKPFGSQNHAQNISTEKHGHRAWFIDVDTRDL